MAVDDLALPSSNHDAQLTFGWVANNDDLAELGLSATGGSKRCAARRAIVGALIMESSIDRWIAYSRDHNFYARHRRYGGRACSYAGVMAVVDELLELHLIEEQRSPPGNLGWQSRIRATQNFRVALKGSRRVRFDPIELVRLKDSEKRLKPYRDNADTRRMRAEVAEINEALCAGRISLSSPGVKWDGQPVIIDRLVVYPDRTTGYRVFNNSWKAGGRYYGVFWQVLPPRHRQHLTIDGIATSESDFHQLHPRLLYALHDAPLHGDAYTVLGRRHSRPLFKIAWQIMINASSRSRAVNALAPYIKEPAPRNSASAILAALEERHARVSNAFYSGVGLSLQFYDSQLMVKVEQACVTKGIIALPIHDSFIVKIPYTEQVREIMDRELSLLLSCLATRKPKIV